MTPPTPPFRPPTPDQIEAHLHAHPPRQPSPWTVWGPLGVIAAMVILGFAAGGIAALLVPWVAIGALFFAMSMRVRAIRDLERAGNRLQEWAMLRHDARALREAWLLLPRVAMHPLLHVRTVAVMAHCLSRLRAHDAAIVALDYLLENLPQGHPGASQLRVQRALAALEADRLTDADDTLRRVRSAIDLKAHTPVSAGFRLAQLLQQVRTHHFADAVAEAGDPVASLRPLGVEAGFGHGLLALCHLRTAGDSNAPARAAWARATTLLPERTLTLRFPELAAVGPALRGDHA